ncbi:MAG: radical SAM protein [Patescibacteria group bacterium]
MSQLTRPLTAQLEITDKCNLRCRHCYHLDFNCKRDSKDLPDEQVMLIAAKLAENHIFSLVITGGEPLVRKGLTRKLVIYFKEKNIDVSLNTNLQLLDQKTLDDLIVNHLDGMLISCPSVDPKIYSHMTSGGDFFRFSNNLKMVLERKQHCSINMVVNRHNLGYIRETAKYMFDLGVEIFGATPMGMNPQSPDMDNLLTLSEVRALIEELVWIKENIGLKVDIFEAIPKCAFPSWIRGKDLSFLNRKCQAGKTIVSIANNGDVRPCSHNPDIYGNILNEELTAIWQRMDEWRSFQNIPDRCTTCKIFSNCHGGCRITAKACTGDCRGEDPWMELPNVSGEWPIKAKSDISLVPEMTVTFAKVFRWRHENEDTYLISSTRNNRNLTAVNGQLFNFVKHLRKISPLVLEDLAKSVRCDFADSEFQRVVNLLTTREFISLGRPERR